MTGDYGPLVIFLSSIMCLLLSYQTIILILIGVYSHREIYENPLQGIGIIVCNAINVISVFLYILEIYFDFEDEKRGILTKLSFFLQGLTVFLSYALVIHNCVSFTPHCYAHTTPLYILILIYTHFLVLIALFYLFNKVYKACKRYFKIFPPSCNVIKSTNSSQV
jgi:UDP-N-acetylmuramyl pentapeptide phosphotransferase/UDP-N-acetylglucosamine-1-phosphate transferase